MTESFIPGVHADYASELDVTSLAREAHMGVSTLHHAFRDATATSPLQYLKNPFGTRSSAKVEA